MNAIYKGKLYRMGTTMSGATLIDDVEANGTNQSIFVDFGDPDLIVDPTDDEINNILPDYEHTD